MAFLYSSIIEADALLISISPLILTGLREIEDVRSTLLLLLYSPIIFLLGISLILLLFQISFALIPFISAIIYFMIYYFAFTLVAFYDKTYLLRKKK
jgi:hypothetical protein